MYAYYIDKFAILHNLPAIFTILAFIFMATMVMVASGGFYGTEVGYFTYILGGACIVAGFALFYWVRTTSTKYIQHYWSKVDSKRTLDGYRH